MTFKTIVRLAVFIIFLLPIGVKAQISQGGVPIQIQYLKSNSSTSDLVVMPAINNQKMKAFYSQSTINQLKPYTFAHSFSVSLSPENSGKWYNTTQINVWQLRIRSTGAYSLNLILNNFKLPEGARLFLISSSTGEIKGAYTSANNTASQVLAIEPVDGDELMVQYEEPVHVSSPGKFLISQVAHDFVGVTSSGTHRPLGISGACNVNVNCDLVNGTEEIRDAVCRIIIEGTEICSGSLVNNTSLDGTPYILTANHCINTEQQAQASVFLFNYESPYCSSIDGDVSHSLSGSAYKAGFDSLDFTLVRLNTIPPYNYRPYLAGWNRKNSPSTSSVSIHHPKGDVKKVAVDSNPPVTANFSSNGFTYYKSGFWNILRWEYGVTEAGSSGGALFDQNKQIIGTLTGGSAACSPGTPTNDYFEKFALSWDHRSESSKQLKFWLDPLNSGLEKLSGMSLNSGKTLCKPATNFKDNDAYAILPITNGLTKKGYYSGSNSSGFTEFAEHFSFSKNCEVHGISLGIAKVKINALYPSSTIDVKVYQGKDFPESLLYSESFDLRVLYNDAMNYLAFKTPVKTVGSFFVSYNISQLHESDSIAVYMANRKSDVTNTFVLKSQTGWSTYNSQNLNGNGSALLAELIACNIDDPLDVNDFKVGSLGARFFPNPLSKGSLLTIETVNPIDCAEEVAVYDLLGKKQNVPSDLNGENRLTLNFSGKMPGIYLVHLETGGRTVIGKVAYIP